MGAQAPQWLLTSFVDAMQQIGATAAETDLEHEGADLMQRWNAPNRQLHNLRRLMNTLTHIDEIASSAHDPDILRVAAWYHGAFLNKALEIKLGGFQANFAATRCIEPRCRWRGRGARRRTHRLRDASPRTADGFRRAGPRGC